MLIAIGTESFVDGCHLERDAVSCVPTFRRNLSLPW